MQKYFKYSVVSIGKILRCVILHNTESIMTFWEEDFLLGLSSRKMYDSPVQLVSSCGQSELYNPLNFALYVSR